MNPEIELKRLEDTENGVESDYEQYENEDADENVRIEPSERYT